MALFRNMLPAGRGELLDGRHDGIGPKGAVELLCSSLILAAVAFQALVIYLLWYDLIELRVEVELVVGVVVQDGAERMRRGRAHVLPAVAVRRGGRAAGLKVGGGGRAARRVAGNVPLLVGAHGYRYRRRYVQLSC